jgi:hypothetical protein
VRFTAATAAAAATAATALGITKYTLLLLTLSYCAAPL